MFHSLLENCTGFHAYYHFFFSPQKYDIKYFVQIIIKKQSEYVLLSNCSYDIAITICLHTVD